eukprot:Seg813.7 transcript_id=Seg813.7/GoldUCD/mRNA.D3Y31 product="Exonuclease V" protein_id=Seg813.7/GoldUCD/D3Y31
MSGSQNDHISADLGQQEIDDDVIGIDVDSEDEEFLMQALDDVVFQTEEENHDEQHSYSSQPDILRKDLKPVDFIKGKRLGLSVTDLVNQFWCEQQFEYSYTHPITKPTPEIVTAGSAIHLERELEVHDIVDITIETKEDEWAVRLLNIYQQLVILSQGGTIRELQIFGDLFKKEIFIKGIIDEIRLNDENKIEVRELKTRSRDSMPAKSQHAKNELQVAIYQKLLNDLLVEKTSLEKIKKYVSLKWEVKLNNHVIEYSRELLIPCDTLNDTYNALENFLEMTKFPEFGDAVIEYCYQNDKNTIGTYVCEYDEHWLKGVLTKQFDYLMGDKPPCGVDIEEAWKCLNCDYNEICSWRQEREEACRKKNAVNFAS